MNQLNNLFNEQNSNFIDSEIQTIFGQSFEENFAFQS